VHAPTQFAVCTRYAARKSRAELNIARAHVHFLNADLNREDGGRDKGTANKHTVTPRKSRRVNRLFTKVVVASVRSAALGDVTMNPLHNQFNSYVIHCQILGLAPAFHTFRPIPTHFASSSIARQH